MLICLAALSVIVLEVGFKISGQLHGSVRDVWQIIGGAILVSACLGAWLEFSGKSKANALKSHDWFVLPFALVGLMIWIVMFISAMGAWRWFK